MTDKGLLTVVAATVLGAGAVALGWVLSDETYLPNLLLQVGSSLLLVAPVVVLGYVLEQRIRQTDDRTKALSRTLAEVGLDVRETAARVDAIGELTREGLRRARSTWDDAVRAAEADASQANLAALLAVGIGAGAIERGGVRFRLGPHADFWLRCALDQPGRTIAVTIERRDAAMSTRSTWPPGMETVDFFRELIVELRALDAFPGEDQFDGSRILRRLIDTVRTGLRQVDQGDARQWGPLIELVGGWAIATRALCRVDRSFGIEAERLLDGRDDWRTYVMRNAWADPDEFTEAYRTAMDLYRAARR